jgi:hypothetical protein
MPPPLIRPAQRDEYDEVARVWMESWVSTGLEPASNFLLAKLRARVPMEIENGLEPLRRGRRKARRDARTAFWQTLSRPDVRGT